LSTCRHQPASSRRCAGRQTELPGLIESDAFARESPVRIVNSPICSPLSRRSPFDTRSSCAARGLGALSQL
jgi:hypothetical protein